MVEGQRWLELEEHKRITDRDDTIDAFNKAVAEVISISGGKAK